MSLSTGTKRSIAVIAGVVVALALLLPRWAEKVITQAASLFNPITQINWVLTTGSGAPSSGACTSSVYGLMYTQTTGPHYFVCTPSGWFQVDGGASSTQAISVTYNVGTGAVASPAGPYLTAPVSGTVSHCYFTTLASDASTNLVFNVKFNGTSILSGSSATVTAGTSAGTISTFTLTSGTVSITGGQKWEFDITAGAADWTGAMQCY